MAERMTQAEYAKLYAIDPVSAEQAVRTGQIIVEGELPASNPNQPAVNGGGLPNPYYMDQGEQQTGLPAPKPPTAPDTLESLSLLLQGFPEKRAALRQQQLQESRDYINKAYQGPSVTDRLWALSQAFLAPRPYRGFAGTLYNLTQGLSGMAEKRRTAEQQRADALFKLQQQYRTGELEDEGTALDLRYKIAKERADAAEAAEKERRLAQKPDLRVVPPGAELVDVNLPLLSPDEAKLQAQALRQNPSNAGKTFRFRGTDNKTWEIVL